jgi:hypothetical protein
MLCRRWRLWRLYWYCFVSRTCRFVLVVSTTPFSMLNFLFGNEGGAEYCAGEGDCGGCVVVVSSVVLVVSTTPFPCSIFFLELKEVQDVALVMAIVEAVLVLFHQSNFSFQRHRFKLGRGGHDCLQTRKVFLPKGHNGRYLSK